MREECIFDDDDYKRLQHAKELGMRVILFDKMKILKDELKKIGLNLIFTIRYFLTFHLPVRSLIYRGMSLTACAAVSSGTISP